MIVSIDYNTNVNPLPFVAILGIAVKFYGSNQFLVSPFYDIGRQQQEYVWCQVVGRSETFTLSCVMCRRWVHDVGDFLTLHWGKHSVAPRNAGSVNRWRYFRRTKSRM